jgi:hypothetical protein
VAFSHLNHTLYLTRPLHLEQIADRVTSDNSTALSLRAHIRRLVLDHKGELLDDEEYIGEGDLENFATLLAGASRLEHFSWDLCYSLLDPGIMQLLQTGCLNLRSVQVTLEVNLDLDDEFIEGRNISALPIIKHLPNCRPA